MRRKVVSGVLAVMGILALSAGAAQAGSGGKPFPLTSFFVCNGINGDSPNQVVGSIDNGNGGTTPITGSSVDIAIPGVGGLGPFRTNVRIGNGAIACAVAKLFVSGFVAPDGVTKAEILPNNLAGTNNTYLVCYTVSVSTRNSGSPHPSYSIISEFFPAIPGTSPPVATETGVQDNGIQFICAPSGITSP